jgi:arginase family enzyme
VLMLVSFEFQLRVDQEDRFADNIDVVEVAPIYDNPGEVTLLAAAEVVHSLIQLMADTPVKPKTV